MARTKTTKAVAAKPTHRAKFADLPRAYQKRIAATLIGGLRKAGYFGRGGYRTVHGPDQSNRPHITAETEGEVGQLTIAERNRLVSLARNAARNNERFEGVLHQVEINVIGVDGGKAIFEFPKGYEAAASKIATAFANWAQEAEYFEDLDLQDVLKLALRTQMIGGDVVLVFDDDVTAASTGQIIAFEPDCVGNLHGFEKRFPGFKQFQGIVKNANGKTVGVTVSWSQRGLSEYSETDEKGNRIAWTLIKPEGLRWRDSLFTIFRDTGRFNQMRGSSRLWPGLGTVADLTDIQGFEVQASKLGAQKIGQILQEAEQNEPEIAAELDPDVEAPIATEDYDAAAQAAQEAAAEAEQLKVDVDEIHSAGVIYDVLPPGLKMELLDTKHPNDKLVEFSTWLLRPAPPPAVTPPRRPKWYLRSLSLIPSSTSSKSTCSIGYSRIGPAGRSVAVSSRRIPPCRSTGGALASSGSVLRIARSIRSRNRTPSTPAFATVRFSTANAGEPIGKARRSHSAKRLNFSRRTESRTSPCRRSAGPKSTTKPA